MKRKLLGIAMAVTMAASGSTSVFATADATSGWGWENSGVSTSINVTLPTGGTLVLKPYSGLQVDTGINYAVNDFEWTDVANSEEDMPIAYDLGVCGYVVNLSTTGAGEPPVLVADSSKIDAASTAKQIELRVQVSKIQAVGDYATAKNAAYPEATKSMTDSTKTLDDVDATKADKLYDLVRYDDPEVTKSGAPFESSETAKKAKAKDMFQDLFDTAANVTSVQMSSASDAAYSADLLKSGEYTKVTTVAYDSLKPGMALPMRITGSMNSLAAWESGDKISVTPIIKVVPKAADSVGDLASLTTA